MDQTLSVVILAALLTAACSSAPSTSPNPPAQGTLGTQSTTSPLSGITAGATSPDEVDYLTNFVRPDTVLRSFHAVEGMWVDCVDVDRQPSLMTPAMTGKRIATPPALPATDGAGQSSAVSAGAQFAQQDVALHANERDEFGTVRHCDPGTIPIRRTTAADLARFTSLHDYFSKGRSRGHLPGPVDPPNVSGYQYAAQGQTVTNWGMQLFLNIWDPSLGTTGIHSISQMWVANTTGGTTETAEAGLDVDQGLFNDTNNHLFIYWTADGYQNTGCYDLNCTGFVQTDNSVVIGGAFSPVSTTTGTQYVVELSWEKSSSTDNWWLLYQGTTWVGYLPASLYSHGMQTQASTTNYGGEVDISAPNGSSLPQMGSGAFASAGATYGAFQSHLQYIDLNFNTIDVSPDANYTGVPNCYSLSSGYQTGTGFYFGTQTVPEPGYFQYFGGPGCQ